MFALFLEALTGCHPSSAKQQKLTERNQKQIERNQNRGVISYLEFEIQVV